MSTLFTKIINREIPADIIYENDNYIVIKDINPEKNTHWLVITKDEIKRFEFAENKEEKALIK